MCHSVPLVASIITTAIWFKKRSPEVWHLNLMLYGACLFGVIDHLWNGEFFMVPANLGKDLSLGVVITAAVLGVWALGRAHSAGRRAHSSHQ